MIAEVFINLICWLYQNTFLKIPTSLPYISINEYADSLKNVSDFLQTPLYAANSFFPITELVSVLIGIIVLELSYLGVRGTVNVINIIRGSGARI